MPFKEDLDRCPIDVGADKYVRNHSPSAEWESLISTQVTVGADAKTLAALLGDIEETVTDAVIETGDIAVLEYSGTVSPHPAMKIEEGTFDITVNLTTGGSTVVADNGGGTMDDGGDNTGTIDYETGEWTLSIVNDTVVDASDITATYNWFLVIPTDTVVQGLWLYPAAADEIRATFSEDGVPTATEGISIAEAMFIAGQPDLLEHAKFYGADTLMDIEVLV